MIGALIGLLQVMAGTIQPAPDPSRQLAVPVAVEPETFLRRLTTAERALVLANAAEQPARLQCIVTDTGYVGACAPVTDAPFAVAGDLIGATATGPALLAWFARSYHLKPVRSAPSAPLRTILFDTRAVTAALTAAMPPLPPSRGRLDTLGVVPGAAVENLADLYAPVLLRDGLTASMKADCRVMVPDYTLFCHDAEILGELAPTNVANAAALFKDMTLRALAGMRAAPRTPSGDDSRGYDVTMRIHWRLP